MAESLEHELDQRRIKDALARAEVAEANMRKAAEYGQQLLSENLDLKKSKELAVQEIHELKNKLDREASANNAFQKEAADDIDTLKLANSKLMEDKQLQISQSNSKINQLTEELKAKLLESESAIVSLQELLKSSSEKLSAAQEQILNYEKTRNSLNGAHDDSSVKEELEILQEQLSQYQVKHSEIIQNNKDLKEENTELLDRLRTQQNDVAELKASAEEAEAEAMGYQQTLNQMRNDFATMQKELSDSSPNVHTTDRGNSLFSEVDDRRQIVEEKLRRFKDQFESMKVQYDKKNQQLMRVKTQNVALLNRAATNDMNPDHNQLYHLQDLLERERSKTKLLNDVVENQQGAKGCTSKIGQVKGSSTQELLQLQMRQNLEADDKLRELTRKFSVIERNESKLRAENYQLRSELSEMKNKATENGSISGERNVPPKSKKGTIREFITFESSAEKENIPKEESIDEKHLIKVLSANPNITGGNNSEKPSAHNKSELNEYTNKPRKAQFSDADPIVYEDATSSTDLPSTRGMAQKDNHMKKTTLGSTSGKRTTNALINAKEESEKLKEQCAQQ